MSTAPTKRDPFKSNYDLDTGEYMGSSMWETAHECDAQHRGHPRGIDGRCLRDGFELGYDCEVHGPTRRLSPDEWKRTHDPG